jgi:repressor LexA
VLAIALPSLPEATMPEPLTPIEQKVYHYLLDFLCDNTYQPSVREIGKQFQIKSTKTVSELLQSLADKGYIERDPSRSRGVKLLGHEAHRRTQPVPYYGKIAAGEPALLAENRKGFITMDRRFLPGPEVFFLRVKGDSMVGRGILDGDYVLLQPQEAKEGDIVAVRIGEEATIKTLRHADGKIVLEPANPAEKEIVLSRDADYAIIGVACGVFRPFKEMEIPSGTGNGPIS